MPRCKTTILLVLLAAASAARGEDAPGTLTRAPAVVEPSTPEYPEAAKAQGLSGEVVLELDVSEEGQVLDARIVKPGGNGFDEAALAAGRKLRFSPAEIDGKPAAVTIEYRFRFEAPAPPPPPAAVATLRGLVLERGTREPLAGVTVNVGDADTRTDGEGRFEIAGLPPGPAAVVALDAAHERFETEETLEAGKALEVRYYLRRAARDAYEAVVVGERDKKEVTSVSLTSGEVSRIAGVSGDTVKVVQNLPGVARAPGGFGLLVVRGGNPTDTRVYVDGVEVPLVFHFGGLTSIMPSELIEAVDFEAGNFGVRYGRATGGRVELRTRDPGRSGCTSWRTATSTTRWRSPRAPCARTSPSRWRCAARTLTPSSRRRRGTATGSASRWRRATTTTRGSSPGARRPTTPSGSRCSAPTIGWSSPA